MAVWFYLKAFKGPTLMAFHRNVKKKAVPGRLRIAATGTQTFIMKEFTLQASESLHL